MPSFAWMTVAVLLLTACQPPQSQQSSEAKSVQPDAPKAAVSRDEHRHNPGDDVGLFRWSSGMQMGQLWAAVLNKKQDTLRFFADAHDDGNRSSWQPDVELADGKKLPREGGLINFVVGDRSVTLQYAFSDGQPDIQLLGNDGSNNAARAVD